MLRLVKVPDNYLKERWNCTTKGRFVKGPEYFLKPKIVKWLEEHNIRYLFFKSRKRILFLKKKDASLFKLTWY